MGSDPDLIWRPSATTPVSFRAIIVPSNVSTKASAMRKFFDRIVMIVELSLSVRSMVVKAANGPLTKNRIEATSTH